VKRIATIFAAVAATALIGAPGAFASDPIPGKYKGEITGGHAKVKVTHSLKASLRYDLKSRCGRVHGKLPLKVHNGRFKGRHASGRREAITKGRFVKGGTKAKGVLRETKDDRGCSTGKRRFKVSLPAGSLGFDFASTVGHYVGANDVGRAVSFDIVRDGDLAAVDNFAADVDTDCWDDLDGDGYSDTLLTHVGGLSGKVDASGAIDVYYAPDDDTEYSVDGRLADGQATMDVVVGGYWDRNGNPSFVGPYQCDSWGSDYTATRVAP
jgi:hypothetical protein